MADAKDFAKELNALITRYIDGAATRRTLLTSCCEKQITCSGTTISKSILKPRPGVRLLTVGEVSR
jgi:hypothetical protein